MSVIEYFGIAVLIIVAAVVMVGFGYGCGFDEGWQEGFLANDPDAELDEKLNARDQRERRNG